MNSFQIFLNVITVPKPIQSKNDRIFRPIMFTMSCQLVVMLCWRACILLQSWVCGAAFFFKAPFPAVSGHADGGGTASRLAPSSHTRTHTRIHKNAATCIHNWRKRALTCDGGGYLSPPAELSALKSRRLSPASRKHNERLQRCSSWRMRRTICAASSDHAAASGGQTGSELSGGPRTAARIVLLWWKSLPSSARTGSMMAWTGMSDSD